VPITMEFDIITPEVARKIAAENNISMSDFQHRRLKQVKSYATDMSAGRWPVNGDSIIFNTSGRLVDGHKRIAAAAFHNVSFPTLVVRGIDSDSIDYIDQHKRRTSKDVAHVAGYDAARTLTAAAASVVDIAHTGLPSQQIVTHWNLLRVIQDFPDIGETIREFSNSPLLEYFTPSDLFALVYLIRRIDVAQANSFITQLIEALSNPADQRKTILSVLATGLRGVNEDLVTSGKSGSSKTRYVRVTYFTKTWNVWRTSGTLRRLRYDATEEPAFLNGLPRGMFKDYIVNNDSSTVGNDRQAEYRAQAKKSKARASIETITPEMAAEMLFNNGPLQEGLGRNRNQSAATIAAYAREILNDSWKITGQAIKISVSGRLLDGQHRLMACIRANKPFTTIVVRDVSDDVFPTFDVGQQKTVSMILKGRGESYGGTIQGALRWIWLYREVGFISFPVKPNLTELLDIFAEYPNISTDALLARNPAFRSFRVPPSILLALITVFREIDAEGAVEFFDSFVTGANLSVGHPILDLRNKLAALAGGRFEASAISRLYLILHAWNAFREGRKLKIPRNVNNLVVPPPFDKGAAPKATILSKPVPAARRPDEKPAETDGDGWATSPAA